MGVRVDLAILVAMAEKDRKVTKVRQAPLDPKVPLGLKARKVKKVIKVTKVNQAAKGYQDIAPSIAHLVTEDRQVQEDLLVHVSIVNHVRIMITIMITMIN
jgi:hypothetical protein